MGFVWPSDIGFSQGAGDSYVPAQWPAALPWDESDHQVSSHLCGTTLMALLSREFLVPGGWFSWLMSAFERHQKSISYRIISEYRKTTAISTLMAVVFQVNLGQLVPSWFSSSTCSKKNWTKKGHVYFYRPCTVGLSFLLPCRGMGGKCSNAGTVAVLY